MPKAVPIDPIDINPIDPKPIEPTQEELDIAEMSSNKEKILDAAASIKMDDAATVEINAGLKISVAQSVRNPGSVTTHFREDSIQARSYGKLKTWTEKKIYQQFGKQFTKTLKAWDDMVNTLATTEIPVDEIPNPVEIIKP